MSAILPMGTIITAMASSKDVATQPNWMALTENSFCMAGRATLTEENMKGPVKDATAATIRAVFSCVF